MAAKPKRPPWAPAGYELSTASAVQALARGEANSAQQKEAVDWIIRKACLTYDECFIAGEPDATANMQGRRSAGLQIVKLINLNLAAFREVA